MVVLKEIGNSTFPIFPLRLETTVYVGSNPTTKANFNVAELGVRGGLVQYDCLRVNALDSCSRTKSASGSSKKDTN